MPRDPPPPPPQGTSGSFGGIMGGYGQATPLPGATQQQQQPMADNPGIHYNFPSAQSVDKKHE